MNISPALTIGILAYSVAVALLTNWLAAGLKRMALPPSLTLRSLIDVVASLVWVGLLYVFGVLAIRYIERMPSATVGYALFATLGFLLSWGRAVLYHRVQMQRGPMQPIDRERLVSCLMHNLCYLLFALVLCLALFWLLDLPVDPLLVIPLFLGALLPDLDSSSSLLGRLVPWISRRLEKRIGPLQQWHTPAAAALVALVLAPLIPLIGVQAWYLIPFGFLSHLVVDLLAPKGIMLAWPLSSSRYGVFGGVIESAGCRAERILAAGLAVTAIILLSAVDLGPVEPAPVPAPTFDQTLDRYYSMRGRNQVFAYIDGSWQLSGQRISGWFEVLNASGESYVILDRFSGEIFQAGRNAGDNVYVNRIVLRTGPSILVKPVELHLKDQPVADGLDIVYDMQGEPGLLHIYAFGNLVLFDAQSSGGPALWQDHTLNGLQKIQQQGDRSYSFQYLTATELIDLASLRVESASLMIVATYERPASSPTATPLPPLPTSEGEPAQ
ncbi:MAG: metal-dependent hydrolase [Anaerolineae bacterium]|jgi:inner membrane protein